MELPEDVPLVELPEDVPLVELPENVPLMELPEDVPLVEFTYLVFTRMLGTSSGGIYVPCIYTHAR